MQNQPTLGDRSGACSSEAHAADRMEFAVLSHLAYLHPVQLTVDEVVHELADGSLSMATELGVKDAITHLSRVGLIRTHGACIVPTRGTLRLFDLWE